MTPGRLSRRSDDEELDGTIVEKPSGEFERKLFVS